MKNLRNLHRKRSKKMKPADESVVILSDSDSDAENEKIVIIDESDTTATTEPDVEVITLDDSVVSNQSSFRIDCTPGPDFIPLNITYNKSKRPVRKKRLNSSPEITVLKMRKRLLTNDMISFKPTATDSSSNRQQTKLKNKLKFKRNVNKKVTVKPSSVEITAIKNVKSDVKKHENDFRKPKTPQIQLSHTNIMNTAKMSLNEGLRPVIIDGCNVAFGFGHGEFSIQGIIYIVQYFQKRGHDEIVCFLPQNYRNRLKLLPEGTTIQEYEKENIIVYTPSRYLNGKLIKPYDDRFVVQYASERGGVIISNDGYLDLINEESSWRTTIEQRIVNFTFARGLLMLPKDPLGPNGPTLDEMLKFP